MNYEIYTMYKRHRLIIYNGKKVAVTLFLVASSPGLRIGCTFSSFQSKLMLSFLFLRSWHRLYVFPRMTPIARFHVLGAGCMFSSTANSQVVQLI